MVGGKERGYCTTPGCDTACVLLQPITRCCDLHIVVDDSSLWMRDGLPVRMHDRRGVGLACTRARFV